VWETQTATLAGFDVDISDIGGWGLDIHHHYNFHEGILQKGDGGLLHLKQYPRTVQVLLKYNLLRFIPEGVFQISKIHSHISHIYLKNDIKQNVR
jgi:hypothetical protein